MWIGVNIDVAKCQLQDKNYKEHNKPIKWGHIIVLIKYKQVRNDDKGLKQVIAQCHLSKCGQGLVPLPIFTF